jgi:hypothetical protein
LNTSILITNNTAFWQLNSKESLRPLGRTPVDSFHAKDSMTGHAKYNHSNQN